MRNMLQKYSRGQYVKKLDVTSGDEKTLWRNLGQPVQSEGNYWTASTDIELAIVST